MQRDLGVSKNGANLDRELLVENHNGDTYRAGYTVRFAEVVYVLHCFQKKSVKGIATPQKDVELIKSRLRVAEADYTTRKGGKKS